MLLKKVSKSEIAVNVWFDEARVFVLLEDGREVSIPINWFPTLRDATQEQRNNWRFIGDGEGIHWEELDEDILIKGLLYTISGLTKHSQF